GYPVIAATCATEALQLYEEHQSAIRLLVTDVIMRVSVAPSLRTISCDHGPSCRFFSSPAIARITALPCTVLPAWQNPSRRLHSLAKCGSSWNRPKNDRQ